MTFKKASIRKRIAALLIDIFTIFYLYFLCVVSINYKPIFSPENFDGSNSNLLIITTIFYILFFAKDSIKGTSFGKWAMGITIRDATNPSSIQTVQKLFIRNLCLILWPIEAFLLLTGRQRLGDRYAKTIVIYIQPKPNKYVRLASLVAIVIFVYLSIDIFKRVSIKSSEAYIIAVETVKNNDEVHRLTGDIIDFGKLPDGYLNQSPIHSVALIELEVIGKVKSVSVYIRLDRKQGGQWTVTSIEL
jgi:uncharacterized RDD family membrane protein YckC